MNGKNVKEEMIQGARVANAETPQVAAFWQEVAKRLDAHERARTKIQPRRINKKSALF